MRPYVGITCPDTKEDILILQEICPRNTLISFGFAVSSNSLQGIDEEPRILSEQQASELISNVTKEHYCVIHYIPQGTTSPKEVFSLLEKLSSSNGGIQINARWPDISFTREIKQSFPDIAIILQTPYASYSLQELMQKILPYKDSVDSFLLDDSIGTGKVLDENVLSSILPLLVQEFPDKLFGIAGGFTPENVTEKIQKIKVCHDIFAIDAESSLRTPEDVFDVSKAKEYLLSASKQ